jgi:hypothetical protein
MRRAEFFTTASLAMRLAGPITLLAILNGCGSQPPAGATSLSPAALPTYGLGDSYQFSDGSSDSVTAVEDDVIHWHANDGSTYTTSRDVLLPRLAWTNGSERGERRISGDPAQLFPLEAGKEVGFSATRTVRPSRRGRPVTVQEDWACGVFDPARMTTKAGVFDTWRVDCTMRETPAVTGNGLIRRNFYYAPDIGFYVRMEEGVGDGPLQVADLSGYTSSDPILASSALRRRSIQLQKALESEVSGSQKTWTDPATGAGGVVSLLDTRRSGQYGWCRDFAERIRWSGRVYALHGTGCRNPAKVWDIVAMASGQGSHD